jgi:hypothetical protein
MDPEALDNEALEGFSPWDPSLSSSSMVSNRLLVRDLEEGKECTSRTTECEGTWEIVQGGMQPSGQSLIAIEPLSLVKCMNRSSSVS